MVDNSPLKHFFKEHNDMITQENNKVISCKAVENKEHKDLMTQENIIGKKPEEDLT